MRVKIIIIMAAVIFVVTAANYRTSVSFVLQSLQKTMEQDLSLSRDLADELISTKISLLKSDAQTVAERLTRLETPIELKEAMDEQLEQYPEFMALTVFDRQTVVARAGYAPTPLIHLTGSRYIQSALNGESVISTTRRDADTGELVLHICVPMSNGRALSATIPGLTFFDILSKYTFWQTGNIFMIDEEGTIIAEAVNKQRVLDRTNFVELGKTDPNYAYVGAYFAKMTKEDAGFGSYTLLGVERFCTFRRIAGSVSGWTLGVTAPLPENPVYRASGNLIIPASLFFCIGLILTIFYSKSAARPYEQIAEQNIRLEELRIAAQAASQTKSAFLANMSHEMRTPLNAIIGLSELTLNSDGIEGEAERNLEKVYSSGMALLGIVNDILDISKIESGRLALSPAEYDTPSMINDVMTLNVVRIGEKPIIFQLGINENFPGVLMGDDLRVKGIFNNIISNALKYTNSGVVKWLLDYEMDGESDCWIVSSISDTGIGIREEDIGRLFSEYGQVDTKTNRRIEGTGLGLAITKRLVEAMDGTIGVKSEYGKGSTFTVRLRQKFVTGEPIGKELANKLINFRYSDARYRRNAKFSYIKIPYARVLVVDDVPTNLDVAKGMMKRYAMQVDCVSSGQNAIEAIRSEEHHYNAVFMDHMMPGMDGIEATSAIRALGTEYARNVPIIALTANAIVGNEEMFLKNGFQAFLSKPIDIRMLDAVIRQWVRDKEFERMTGIGAEGQEETKATDRRMHPDRRCGADRRDSPMILKQGLSPDDLDMRAGLKKFGYDESVFISVLRSYAVHTRTLFARLNEYLAAENMPDYAVTVHGIKGSSYGISATKAGKAAEALEYAAKAGDLENVKSSHRQFADIIERLLDEIDAALARFDAEHEKPKAASPDPGDLRSLQDACRNYDMDEIDAVMTKLESFEYASGAQLVVWLREKDDALDFDEIVSADLQG